MPETAGLAAISKHQSPPRVYRKSGNPAQPARQIIKVMATVGFEAGGRGSKKERKEKFRLCGREKSVEINEHARRRERERRKKSSTTPLKREERASQ